MRHVQTLLWGALLVFAAGCGRQNDDAFAEAAPDIEGLTLELSGAAAEQALMSEDGVQRQGLHENPPELLKHTRQAVAWLNGHVRKAVEPIVELIASGAGKVAPGDSRIYGPKDRGNATYRLTIKRLSVERFNWKLEAKPLGSGDEAYKAVAAGTLVKGALPHRGRGTIGIDVDTLKSIDSSIKGAGKLFCGFAHVGDTKTLVYLLKGFTPDVSAVDPVSAAFVGHRLMPSKATRVRLAAKVNLGDSPTAAKEFIRARARYIPGVGGRADALATEGDVPAGKVYFGSACWDAQEHEGFAILRLCNKGDLVNCTVVATRGDLSNCKPGVESAEAPPEDELDTTLEQGAPADGVVAPSGMPEP
ncbi:MAG: hypothetical protein HYZ28_00725 [Myxococcales bacterium]|nr:hypothetical protein [Myxococcales bacterium]